MRVVVIGLGIQGAKRLAVARDCSDDVVATVDPVNAKASHRGIREIPIDGFDAALVCVPDPAKIELLDYLLRHGKHVLVEKPLFSENDRDLERLRAQAQASGAVCYTAYNHRFEPHFVRMQQVLKSGEIGRIYSCRMFYGNGTARDVRNSLWRDKGSGVLADLGSHLLDTAMFWFGDMDAPFTVWSADRFENAAFDHITFGARGRILAAMEISLMSWRNHFAADVYAEHGSLHIDSLCKWGPSVFTRRSRVLPSGRPPEEAVTLVQSDPTWVMEYAYFKELCAKGAPDLIAKDIRLNAVFRDLAHQVLQGTPG